MTVFDRSRSPGSRAAILLRTHTFSTFVSKWTMKPIHALNHVGIAVRSIAEQRPFYEQQLGAKFECIEEVPSQKVRVAFLRVHDVRLELLEPTDPSSTVQTFLDKRGEGLHHLAFTVDNLPERIAELKASGVRMIDESPRVGAHQMQIAFIHPKSSFGVLTELCEPRGEAQHNA
mgnify:CR=1 FL=1